MTNLKDMLAVKDGALERKHLIGTVTFFTVPDRAVSVSKVRRLWQAEGLNLSLIPEDRKASHVFQAACRSVETRRTNGNGNGDAEVKVDEVLDDLGECVYQITRLLRDKDNRVIDFPPSMRVVFNKDTKAIKFEGLEAKHYDALKHLRAQIEDHFEKNSNKLPGQKIRNAIRDTLKGLHAETMRKSGGVYFVPIAGASTLESIGRVLEKLYNGDASLALIPMANSEGARELVREHHNAEVIEECESMIAELAALNKRDRNVRPDKMANLIQQRRALSQHRKVYVEILESDATELREKEKVLDAQLEKLMERAMA